MTRIVATSAALAALILALPDTVEAREERSEQVPNGQKLDCNLCHTMGGGSARNPFGTQIEMMGLSGVGGIETQEVEWAAIYNLDADGDGFTNGYELGDPDGVWVPTDNDPAVDPSLPGDVMSVPCPNGSVHPDEDCDGADLNDQTCLSLGFTGGVLSCAADCTFDTSQCMAPEFPDMDNPIPTTDMGSTPVTRDMAQAPNPDPTPDGADTGPSLTASDVNGCAGPLEITHPDQGAASAMFLFLLFVWRRRT